MSQNPENSDSDEWEVVDVISNSTTISTKSPKLKPQLSTSSNSGIQTQRLYNSSHGSLININVNNGMKDEEKQSLLISSKITESRDLNDLNRKHDMKQSLYQTQLDIYKQKQKEYLQNWSSKQNFNKNNNNNNSNEELLKIKTQKQRQEEELRKMKDLCEKYLREKEKLENEISKQREQNQEMQKFTQQILENQSKYQLEHQKQILNMQNNKNNNNNNQNQNQNNNSNNFNNNYSNEDSREFSVLNVDEDNITWQCSDCKFINDESSKFCKQCAKLNPIFGGSLNNNNNNNFNNNNNDNNVINYNNILPSNEPLLENEGLVGEKKCLPCEKRQIGWILKNISNIKLNFNSLSLEILSEGKNTTSTNKITIDEIINKKLYKLDVNKNEEFYLFINFKAPSLPGKYTYFFNLYDINKPNRKILKPLQLVLQVKKQYDNKKENAIKQLLQMNITSDREAIVYLLEQNKWNLENTADALLEQFQN